MRFPAYVEEVGLPEHRSKLWFSVRSGLTIVVAFTVFGLFTMQTGLIPWTPLFWAPVGLKLVTNTLAWWSLKADRFVVEAASLNVAMDTLALTFAIYLSGGLESPLFAVYAIELTVVALLSNVGVTLTIMGLAMGLHAAMACLIYTKTIPSFPPPHFAADALDATHLMVVLFAYGVVLGIPTVFTTFILSDLRAKSRALEQRTRDLEAASQSKARFIANLTHELRTPIHGISGLADLLEAGIYGPVTDRQRKAHVEVKRSARSLLALVDGLLSLARSEDGRITPKLERVDVSAQIEAAVAHVQAMVGTRDLPIEVEVAGRVSDITTDAAMLQHILTNLVTNAVKFTPDGGRVLVRAHSDRRGGAVVIEVEDTGVGIAMADRERIFEPFQQVHDGSFVREHGGVGLGLALVRQLVQAIGGTIEVSSEVGRGSVFRVVVPSVASAVAFSA
ncbi:MAG: HAMP domain-containing sensor histidine kinase [Polyangiales bacterium]|nr:HAMP domain-containing histidine kinase [Myxococcales bacterium]MCB9658571.1 HAMP domain-containing histidine kinase [Sandaracinaceae bacterium]